MGSPSLMIVLILVVWIIVLAPLVVGNNKPIRRSGEGYDETRVLHEGGSAPMETRRRPKFTAADIHRHNDAADYELVEAIEDEEPVLIDDSVPTAPATPIDGEVIAPPKSGGSTALSVLRARQAQEADAESEERYELEDSYYDAADYGMASPVAGEDETDAAPETEPAESAEATEPAEPTEAPEPAEPTEAPEPAGDADFEFAAARRGRGGYDPERERSTTATRYQRRQRTLLGLIAAFILTFVLAFVAGGWVWILPAITAGLTIWFLAALRRVVVQERALRQRRLRQLRRARLGVASQDHAHDVSRRRAGGVVLELDDEHPDFDILPTARTQDDVEGPEHRGWSRDWDGGYGKQAS